MSDKPSGGDALQAQPTAPQDFDAGLTIAFVTQEPAELGLGGGKARRATAGGEAVDKGIQGVPLGVGEGDGTADIGGEADLIGQPEQAPSHHAVHG